MSLVWNLFSILFSTFFLFFLGNNELFPFEQRTCFLRTKNSVEKNLKKFLSNYQTKVPHMKKTMEEFYLDENDYYSRKIITQTFFLEKMAEKMQPEVRVELQQITSNYQDYWKLGYKEQCDYENELIKFYKKYKNKI